MRTRTVLVPAAAALAVSATRTRDRRHVTISVDGSKPCNGSETKAASFGLRERHAGRHVRLPRDRSVARGQLRPEV